MNNSMQSFSLNIQSLDTCGHGFQSILLYPKIQFVSTYFHVFLKSMFCINFHIPQKGLGI